MDGDAWKYCDHLNDLDAIKSLVQAALGAYLAIEHARQNLDSNELASVTDWPTVQRELKDALHAIGHPAGG